MFEGKQPQEQQQEVQPQPAPLYLPEQPEPEFTVDQGRIPSLGLWNEAKEVGTTGFSLLRLLHARVLNHEADLQQKFVGFLLSHKITRGLGMSVRNNPEDYFPNQPPASKFLTNEQYEKSEYQRPGLQFPNGVYENIAQIEARHYDDQQIYKDIKARVDQGTWPSIARGAAGFAGGLANPIFFLLGGAAGRVAAPAAEFLTKFIPEIKSLSPEANIEVKNFARSAGIGGAVMPVFTGIDYAEERANQEDASIKNILYSIPIGMGFGIGGETLSRVLSSNRTRLKSRFAKEENLNEKVKDEPEPIVQEPIISNKNHETMLTTAVSQMENGKLPEVSEIGKQNYHEDWQENLGDKLRNNPIEYEKELEDLRKSKDINDANLDSINNELDRLEKENVPLVDDRVSSLMMDKDKLLAKKLDIEDMIDSRENAPEQSNMQDLHSKIEKMNSPQSDFSYYDSKELSEVPPEEKSKQDYINNMSENYDKLKKDMSSKVKDLGDDEAVKSKAKGTQKMLKAIEACLRRAP
jgi:hypothetical protein